MFVVFGFGADAERLFACAMLFFVRIARRPRGC
jgi:hypothetical protein